MDRTTLQRAFDDYLASVERIARTGDWASFAELFTPDATYCEHAYGDFRGREEIREWIVRTMTTFPGNQMVAFPPAWVVLDPENCRVVCEIRNLMHDPGDGSVHEASNITILSCADDGLWSREEDVYNPKKFADMVRDWSRVAHQHGTLDADGQRMLVALGG